jgi:mRNA-degrading endonuclease HigB of HigAB toxin-antitoxin module
MKYLKVFENFNEGLSPDQEDDLTEIFYEIISKKNLSPEEAWEYFQPKSQTFADFLITLEQETDWFDYSQMDKVFHEISIYIENMKEDDIEWDDMDESLKIDEDEVKDIMIDLSDDGFEIVYFHHPNDFNTYFIRIDLPSGKNYSWSDIKQNILRLISYLDYEGLKYKFSMIDSSRKSHHIEIVNDLFKCTNDNGNECQMCKYGLPRIDLSTNIYEFEISVLAH